MRGAPQKGFARLISRISCRTSRVTLGLPGRRRDFQRQKVRNPARCHRTIVSGRTIVTASRTVGASRYSNIKISRSNTLRAGRLGVLRRSTFTWCRSAITSPSSELLDRKRSRSIHLSRLKSTSTRRSSPDSGARTKRMEFAVKTPLWGAPRIHGEFLKLGIDVGRQVHGRTKAPAVAGMENVPCKSCRWHRLD
jgi:hypothetical protein